MMRRWIWNALAAALFACLMPPLLTLTTFDRLLPFLPMLTFPLLASHLKRLYFLGTSLLGLIISFYWVLTPGQMPWALLGEIFDDVQRVLDGSLPGKPAFAFSIGLISFLVAYLARRTFPNRGFVYGLGFGILGFIAYCDTWTGYSGETFIFWPIALSLLLLYATEVNERPVASYVRPVSALLIIGAVMLAAMKTPALAADWQDSWYDFTARFQGEGEGTSSIQKVGYGNNDQQLGGPFQMDHRAGFRGASEGSRYWRVETKDIYTGKGWILSQSDPEIRDEANFRVFGEDVEKREEQATFEMTRELPFVPYNGNNVQLFQGEDSQDVLVDEENQKISYLDEADRQKSYRITYDYPIYTERILASDEPVNLSDGELERYLQLPETLPERVRVLAQEIVEGEETPYDRAKAIEGYFDRENFVYDTQDVPVPAEDQDYVDQFLFETQAGYCDNFSTAATVLLRAAGLPARWVKGFTGGESDVIGSAVTSYTVRNKNAHSWVEVYIEGPGWVALEPTVSFDGNGLYTIDRTNESETERANPQRDTAETEPPARQERPQENPFEQEQASAVSQDETQLPIWPFVTGGIILLIGFIFRRQLLRMLALLYFRKRIDNPRGFGQMYRFLLHRLEKQGFRYKEGRTLRELSREVDQYYEIYAMRPLTDAYERLVYGGEALSADKKREYFENIIRRVEG